MTSGRRLPSSSKKYTDAGREIAVTTKIALVTNVLDYAGPPAVKSLLEGGYRVARYRILPEPGRMPS